MSGTDVREKIGGARAVEERESERVESERVDSERRRRGCRSDIARVSRPGRSRGVTQGLEPPCQVSGFRGGSRGARLWFRHRVRGCPFGRRAHVKLGRRRALEGLPILLRRWHAEPAGYQFGLLRRAGPLDKLPHPVEGGILLARVRRPNLIGQPNPRRLWDVPVNVLALVPATGCRSARHA